jgi:O-antigen ligase
VLAVNGLLLGIVGIVQRLEGSGKLLFLVRPEVNPDAVTQFGPYAYRANASQYFNLLWPVCLGFWWTLHRERGFRRSSHHLLLVCAIVMAACPIISTSRGGALITVGLAVFAAYFLSLSQFFITADRRTDPSLRRRNVALLAVFFLAVLGVGYWLGWQTLAPRMEQIDEGFAYREEMYENARPMAWDYPWYGIGPGTFEVVFQLYRLSTDTYWPAQLHNDWLETRITFGWVGLVPMLMALGTVACRWLARGGIYGGRRFVILSWLSVAGVLVHARFDFPFQIHSIVLLFLVICAILFSLSRRP